MSKRISNSGGFVFLETILITILLSAAAMMIINGFHSAQKISQETAIKTAAIHLANARIAELQYQFATGSVVDDVTEGDIIVENLLEMTLTFNVSSSVNGNHAVVTVRWTFDGVEENSVAERDIFNR